MPAPPVVIALAALGLLFSVIGMAGKGFSLLGLLMQQLPAEMRADVVQIRLALFFGIVGFIVSVLLLIGSVGIIYVRQWGRRTMLTYAVAALLLIILQACIAGAFVHNRPQALAIGPATLPATLPASAPSSSEAIVTSTNPATQPVSGTVRYLGIVSFAAMMSVYPVALLMVLRRPDIKRAFQQPARG